MKQVFIGGMADAPTAAATEYAPIFSGTSSNTWASTEYWRAYRIPVTGSLSRFKVAIDTAPGTGKSVTFTIRKNSADTAAVVTISDLNTSGEYTGAAVSYTAGDTITIKSTQTNTPTLFTYSRWSILYEGNTAKMSTMMGGTGSGWSATAGTFYLPTSGGYSPGTSSFRRSLVGINGTIKSFYYSQNAAADTGVTYVVSIYKNGSIEASSSITFVAATGLNQSVTGLNIDIAPGDLLSIGCVITGTVTNNCGPNGWGIGIEADVEGESNVCGMSYNQSTTATEYSYITNQSAVDPSTTESQRLAIGGSLPLIELSNMYVTVLTAMGTGKARTTTLRKNSAAANQSVALSESTFSGTDSTHTDLFSDFDTVDIETSSSGTPAAGVTLWAFKMIEKVYDLNVSVVDSLYTMDGPSLNEEGIIISFPDYNSAYSQYSGSGTAYLGQSFLTPSGEAHRLTSINIVSALAGAPTGTHYVRIYRMSGTYGSTSLPTGSSIAVSDGNDVAEYSTGYLWRTHTFSGDNQILLTPDTYYVFVHYYTGGDSTNKILSAMDTTTPTYGGNLCYSSNGSTYTAIAGYDEAFVLNGSTGAPLVVKDPTVDVSDSISIVNGVQRPNIPTISDPLTPLAVGQESFGTISWVNTSNILSEDGNFTTVTLSNEGAYQLNISDLNFNIPTGSTISGIKLEIKGKNTSGVNGLGVFEISSGSGYFINLTTTNEWNSFGGPTTDWQMGVGEFTPEYINSSAFSFGILPEFGDLITDTISLDSARVTVYYTPPEGGLLIYSTLSDISVTDDITIEENAEVALFTFIYQYYVVITETISVTDSVEMFIDKYLFSVSDSISITEYTEISSPELNINVSDSINTTEAFVTAYTIKAFDGKTASRWGFIESSAGRSVARDSTGTVYTVFISYGTTYSNYEVWIARSTDGGKTWLGGTDEKMIYRISSSSCFSPKIAIDSSDNIYVTWIGHGAFNNPTVNNIALKKGTFANLNTQTRIDVTDSSVAQGVVAIAVDGYDNLHIVAQGLGYGTNSGIYQIFYRKYLSSGSFVTTALNLTDETLTQATPDIVIDRSNNIHIAWYGAYSGDGTYLKVRYIKYTESTQSWGSIDSSLVSSGSSGQYPTIALDSNDKIHIAYWSNYYTKYSNLISGSWVTPINIVNTTAVSGLAARQSISIDKQDNISIASESPNGTPAVFDMTISRYTNGAWQTSKRYAYSTFHQVKPNLMFAVHPMLHSQPNIPLHGTSGVWVDGSSTSSTSSAGNIMFHRDIDLTYQSDIYINVHDHVNTTESTSFFLLQLYITSIYDSVTISEGTIFSEGPLSPDMTIVNTENIEIIDSLGNENRTGTLSPFYGASTRFSGQTFYNANSCYLDSATFYIGKTGAPTGTIQYEIYALTGTPGTNGTPTGAALAVSNTYDVTLTNGLIHLDFSGAQKIILNANTWYGVLINYTNVTGTAGVNYMEIGYNGTGILHSGNFFYSSNGTSWTANSSWDGIFYVYTKNINDILWNNTINTEVSDDVYSTVILPDVIVDSWDTLDPPNWTNLFTCRQGSRQYRGQTFTSDTPIILDRAVWPLTKHGTPTGNLYVKIYAMTGTYGTTGAPTGAPLAISEAVDGSTVVTDDGFYNFEYMQFQFTGANRITLNGGIHYCVVLDIQAGDANNNYFNVPSDVYAGHDGNATNSEDGITWTAGADNDFYVYGISQSSYLEAIDFGFNIPLNRTITGIKVEIEEKTTGATSNNVVRLQKSNGIIGTTNRANGDSIPASDTYMVYGGTFDTWGQTWTPADINGNLFGVLFTAHGIGTVSADHVRITVYYSTLRPDVAIESMTIVSSDIISISESQLIEVSVPEFLDLSTFDNISIIESTIETTPDLTIDKYDSIGITENTILVIPDLSINKYDSINIAESVSIPPVSIYVDKFESISISENTAIFFLNWVIDVSDLIYISAFINDYGNYNVPKTDNITISESVSIVLYTELLPLVISIYETIIITEASTVAYLDFSIYVYDNINILDNFLGYSAIYINIYDLIIIEEGNNEETLYNIGAMDNILITETAGFESFLFSYSVRSPLGTRSAIGRPVGSSNAIRNPVGIANNICRPSGFVK